MADSPWQGDAVGLVEAFRAGERTPEEELEAVFAALDASELNAVCWEDRQSALDAARAADVSLPFGGVPIGVKELNHVAGWPYSQACSVFDGRVADHTTTMVDRLVSRGGVVLAGQTTASEFGGVNVTRTEIHGVTHNPWGLGRTPGGSSGGSAATVAGGIHTMATAGDGGGSIRIPGGFTGLVGLKGTFGRIPLGPQQRYGGLTVATGCLTRSVRDTARWFDLTAGHHATDPLSLPPADPWEPGLGTHAPGLRGARVAFVPDWGGATVSAVMWELLEAAGQDLADELGMVRVDGVDTRLPRMGAAWSIAGMISIRAALGDHWPGCADQLTVEIRQGLELTEGRYGEEARAKMERRRMELNDTMARLFDTSDGGVDFVVTASNPDVAFAAEGPLPDTFGGVRAGAGNNGLLTFPANLHGNPAISIPAGTVDGLPIGLQVVGRHFSEPQLLDLALTMERIRPWPLVAPPLHSGS